MSQVIAALRLHAARTPHSPAIEDGTNTMTYSQLLVCVEQVAEKFREHSPRVLALLADNGIGWILADLAALMTGICTVPLPLYFSTEQRAHVLRSAGVDCIVTDQVERLATDDFANRSFAKPLLDSLFVLDLAATPSNAPALPEGTQKITFTSGTTGEPKGVCLGVEELETAAESLRVASAATSSDRHLCILPMATLLENIGGIYAPILVGATICAPALAHVGLSGSSSLNIERFVGALHRFRATSAIVIPQMLQALVAAGNAGIAMPRTLRYLAVGGAPVSDRMLDAAERLGLPVHEGYGLSECASVVAVNRPGATRRGSVGKPLPHVQVTFASDGEIRVRGVRWRGYLGDDLGVRAGDDDVATGDLGYLDGDGYLHLSGRKKNIFITSFGRNIAPEWVESELVSHPPILQAAIFGESAPFNTAVIFAHPAASDHSVEQMLFAANDKLPDYARAHRWVRATEPFSASNGLATPNGRLRRHAIFMAYANQIDAHYSPITKVVSE